MLIRMRQRFFLEVESAYEIIWVEVRRNQEFEFEVMLFRVEGAGGAGVLGEESKGKRNERKGETIAPMRIVRF